MSWKSAAIGAPILTGILLSGIVQTGCVERKMIVRTDPAGARLLLELDEIEGRTPLEVPFKYGGLREVTILKPGYKVLETSARLEDPWFAYFPLDFFAEILWPGTIHDVQEFEFTLEPYAEYDESQDAENRRRVAELRERADAHRRGGAKGPQAGTAQKSKQVPLPPPIEESDEDPPPPPPRMGR